METSETQHIDKTGWHEITDADYEKAEMDLLREALKRSYIERFLMMTSLIKDDIKAHPEKYPYKKSGLYIGGIRWEDGDEITTGEDGSELEVGEEESRVYTFVKKEVRYLKVSSIRNLLGKRQM